MSSNDETGHRLNHRNRYVLAAVIALVACGALAIAAGAGTSRNGSTAAVRSITGKGSTDSCGYPNNVADTALYPRANVTFNESTVLRGFAPANGAFIGDDIKAFYSDEWGLTLGGPGADYSTSANGNDDINPNFGGALTNDPASGLNDPAGRPHMPVLYVTKIADGGSANNPAAGDWQAGALHNTTAALPNEVHGAYGGLGNTGKARPENGTRDGAMAFPASLSADKYTATVVWHVDDLNLDPNSTYKLQFMVHDGDTGPHGGDVGEGCVVAKTPKLSTMANHAPKGSGPTTPAIIGQDTIQDVLSVDNVPSDANVSAVFKLYAPTVAYADAVCGTNLVYTSATKTRIGPGSLGSDQIDPRTYGKKAGLYKWQATVWVNGRMTALGCGDTSGNNNEVSAVDITKTETTTGQKVTVKDKAVISGFVSGDGPATVRFRLYEDSTCSGTPIYDATKTIDDATGSAVSDDVSVQNLGTTDKTFYWLVQFSGNDFNKASTSECGKETFTIHPDGSGTDP